MKSLKFCLFLSLIIFSINTLRSQDLIFSNFNNAPLYLNPALTGNFEGKARINYNFKNLWNSTLQSRNYRYTAVSLDSKINLGKNQIGYGVSADFDKIGENIDYGTQKFNLHSAYIFNFGDKEKAHHSISIGGSFAYGAVGFVGQKSEFVDLSAGAVWKYVVKPRLNFELGSSIFHFNTPDLSPIPTYSNNLYERLNIHGLAEFPVTQRVSILPSFLVAFQGPHESLIFGSEAKVVLGNKADSQYPFIKLGAFGNGGTNSAGTREFTSYTATTTFETRDIKLGLSLYSKSTENTAFEVTAGLKL